MTRFSHYVLVRPPLPDLPELLELDSLDALPPAEEVPVYATAYVCPACRRRWEQEHRDRVSPPAPEHPPSSCRLARPRPGPGDEVRG